MKSFATIISTTILGLALVSAVVNAETYFVSPDGNPDGAGTREDPLCAWHAVHDMELKPGDEVIFMDGVYSTVAEGRSAFTIRSMGTEDAPILFRAENRHGAIFDGGKPLTGWRRSDRFEGAWECRTDSAPRAIFINGEGYIERTNEWRGQGDAAFVEGTFIVGRLADLIPPQPGVAMPGDAAAADQIEGGLLLVARPWAGAEPEEAFAVWHTILTMDGAYCIADGFLIRRGITGVHLKGRAAHAGRQEVEEYRDLSGLAHNVYGMFNILRNCIVRDQRGSALTSNESRFNLIEDNVIYNAGNAQGDHGIYISQGAENLTLRRNVWWRTSGGAIHVYSGSGIDSPRNIVVEYNIFGPDKRNRCFPIRNRKSTALYIWGGSRWAGGNRIVNNIVIGPHDRAMSIHRANFNLIANNTFLNSDGAPVQIGSGFGNLYVNNILEFSPGGHEGPDYHVLPRGYYNMLDAEYSLALSTFTNNVYLPRDGEGADVPEFDPQGLLVAEDPFIDRDKFDYRLRPGVEAAQVGINIPYLVGANSAAGALQPDQEIYGPEGKFPEIPQWLLEEWPLEKRGQ